MSSSAQAKVISYLKKNGGRDKISNVEIMAGVSQPTIYRMIAKGLVSKVDGLAEVYLKEPVQINTTEKVTKIKGGYTENDRTLAATNNGALVAKLDYLVQQNARLTELVVALGNSTTSASSIGRANVGSTKEKTDPLAETKKAVNDQLKANKITWATVEKIVDEIIKKHNITPTELFAIYMHLEYRFTNDVTLRNQVTTESHHPNG